MLMSKEHFKISAALLLSLSFFTEAGVARESENNFSLITQNQYLGTSVRPLLDAIATFNPDSVNPVEINNALVQINTELNEAILNVKASHTVERLFTQAETIIERMPHVVALQEVVKISCDSIDPNSIVVPDFCTTNFPQSLDHLSLTKYSLMSVGYSVARNRRKQWQPVCLLIQLQQCPLDAKDFSPLADHDVLLAQHIEATAVS